MRLTHSFWDRIDDVDVLILDNRDSFTFNLAHRIYECGSNCCVVRSDEITMDDVISIRPKRLVISPGPGHPKDAGVSVDAVRALSGVIPILGVCLGHQAIAVAFGGVVTPNGSPFHGKSSPVELDKHTLFEGISTPSLFARYHSMSVERPLPNDLLEIARFEGLNMALCHKTHPTFGVQFHPESVLSGDGMRLLRNFLWVGRQSSSNSEPVPPCGACPSVRKSR